MSAILPVYAPAPVTPVRGEGIWLIEADGTRWLDCIGGVATNALGHCHPVLVSALRHQADKLWHISNALRIDGQQALAQRLVDSCFADRVFFCNTGTEAVECAIKMARKYHAARGETERVDVIGLAGSFHGRTFAALNASGNDAYLSGFGPRMPGFVQLDLDDAEAIEAAIGAATAAAVIIEPVQGEGGARAISGEMLLRLRRLCTANGVLLIHDEVQSGMGRTGKLFAHQWFDGAAPDIMAIAKALGAGFPVGACVASETAAAAMTVGTHGSTFGGNPLAMAVATAAFDVLADEAMLSNAREISGYLRDGLAAISRQYPQIIQELRGKGLLVGLKLAVNNREFMAQAREEFLLLSGGGDNIVRILPPLILTRAEGDEILRRVGATCEAIATQRQAA
ncbi:MAG: aspartate aminotransferase family protein [Candidatus Sphingomonas colombiensis]|nr:aspartate aminotransferase family protein [Sphingomonas sp.]WEK42005.1 MAG: aspartate aminotransferase family protein [Sphingomonas sp.]